MEQDKFAVLNDEVIEGVLTNLYEQAAKQNFSLLKHYLPQILPYLMGKGFKWNPKNLGFYEDKYLPISPQQGIWLYLQARAINAKRIVEFGTSFGISTIFLA